MKKLAEIMRAEMTLDTQEWAMVVSVGHYQVLVLRDADSFQDASLRIVVNLNEADILPETAWILLNELASKLNLSDFGYLV